MSFSRPQAPITLKAHSTVAVLGAGPAGAFFAIHLLRDARRIGLPLDVLIIEKQSPSASAGSPWVRKGCNCCAGSVSPRLYQELQGCDLVPPQQVVQEEIDRIWIQGRWKNFPLRVPRGMKMFSVFRGTLPPARRHDSTGFDAFLLQTAVQEGARILTGEVIDLDWSRPDCITLGVKTTAAETQFVPASFVAVATGVNPIRGSEGQQDPITRSIRVANPAFRPAQVRRAMIFELCLGREYLKEHMHREVHFIEYGSKELQLEHIALVPKGDYLTVTLIGPSIDTAALPGGTKRIIEAVLSLPHIERIVPDARNKIAACVCFPHISVRPACNPYADRLALIGDAAGTRLNKDGLYSAHRSARGLAKAVLTHGIDRSSLLREYGKVILWLKRDNRYGRAVFRLIRFAFGAPIVSRILYQAFATELKTRDKNHRLLTIALWKVASGFADYREVFRDMIRLSMFRSLFVGGFLVTMRNILTEAFFGLKWGEFGRYPTVVVKDKRDYIKDSLENTLRITLDSAPDFERMYALKVRAPAAAIFEALGTLGEMEQNLLNLRFVRVRRTQGLPNQVGSVITYTPLLPPVSVQLELSSSVRDTALLYQVSDRLTERGKLIFQINPTQDGNHRLVIYAAFDYKRGQSWASAAAWGTFWFLFPEFAHDVVWNHALCGLKEAVESRARERPTRS